MIDSKLACDRRRGWPSRSRTQGAAFGGAKGKPEDAEMRCATTVIRACGRLGSIISVSVAIVGGRPEPAHRGVLARSCAKHIPSLVLALLGFRGSTRSPSTARRA